ncbi:MAG: DUF3604 domain-containing protein [Steroidobacteraceae bacterium]
MKTKPAAMNLAAILVATLAAAPARPQGNPEREAFFGETHIHTSWSFDAYIYGNTMTGPEEAYKFALGETIKHPGGYDIKITRPLDFMAVTDHIEYAGTIRLANEPGSALSKLPIAEKLKVRTPADMQKIYLWLGESMMKGEPVKELVDPAVAGGVWKEFVKIADKYYQPGKFSTFAAYEWTSTPDNRNMHRNIIFKDTKKVPELPYTSLDSAHPEDLWKWMDGQRKGGNELLAISHNANLSDGIMFPLEVDSKNRPIDAAWAQERVNNEPLTEIHQLKGTSETHPVLSPNDEFAGYEIMTFLLGGVQRTPKLHGSYVREAYENGLAMQQARGYNPYKMGVVGASDSHDTAAGYSQSDYFGGHALADASPQVRLSGKVELGLNFGLVSTGGLGGVWAESNTREALFNAMLRKETFGTSGVRIRVRFFGGWGFRPEVLTGKDWVKSAYKEGVPMGGDLAARKGNAAPTFVVWAVKDPDDGNLDRIQIVKGWTKDAQIFEKIYDVVWSGDRKPDQATGKLPPVGDTVDLKNASYTNTIGAAQLMKVWKDPDFNPELNAFYYARVIQIPTPRWSTYDAKKLGVPPPSFVAPTVQERAWTSPIWYTPTVEEAREGEKGAIKVADLAKKGAVALDDTQLKDLVIGKTIRVRNRVTSQRFDILYGRDGRRLITSIDGKQPPPGEPFDVMASGELGAPAPYEIQGGRLITTVGMTPFEVTVYREGNKLLAARSNEFGYANYEIEKVLNE